MDDMHIARMQDAGGVFAIASFPGSPGSALSGQSPAGLWIVDCGVRIGLSPDLAARRRVANGSANPQSAIRNPKTTVERSERWR